MFSRGCIEDSGTICKSGCTFLFILSQKSIACNVLSDNFIVLITILYLTMLLTVITYLM